METRLFRSRVDTPIGSLVLIARDGAIFAIEFEDQADRSIDSCEDRENAALTLLRRELSVYFAGELDRFTVPLAPRGSAFQNRVWNAVREIPAGAVRSYGEIARSIGAPNASRAVGAANGDNPWPIVVPCHRVVGADGRLTGYAGGLERKERLLRHERALMPA